MVKYYLITLLGPWRGCTWQRGHGGAVLSGRRWIAEALGAHVCNFASLQCFCLCGSGAWERLRLSPNALVKSILYHSSSMLSVLRLHSSFSMLTQHLFGNPKQAGFEIMPATMSSGTQHIFKTKFASSC